MVNMTMTIVTMMSLWIPTDSPQVGEDLLADYGKVRFRVGMDEDQNMVEFITPDPEVIAARDAFNADRLAGAARILEDRGVEDAQTKIDRYKALVEKWEGLVTPGMSPDELGALRDSEIWSQVDFAAYGQ